MSTENPYVFPTTLTIVDITETPSAPVTDLPATVEAKEVPKVLK